MSSQSNDDWCAQTDLMVEHVLRVLSPAESALADAHRSICPRCREAADSLNKVVNSFAEWPIDLLRPATSTWDRLSERIGGSARNVTSATPDWSEPEWEEVASGISCKLLSNDSARDQVAMLVRLAPGIAYPPHTHSGVEELHLLDGELWIDDRKLYPGDYNRGEPGATDRRVWSETGCTCVLITSPSDVLG